MAEKVEKKRAAKSKADLLTELAQAKARHSYFTAWLGFALCEGLLDEVLRIEAEIDKRER